MFEALLALHYVLWIAGSMRLVFVTSTGLHGGTPKAIPVKAYPSMDPLVCDLILILSLHRHTLPLSFPLTGTRCARSSSNQVALVCPHHHSHTRWTSSLDDFSVWMKGQPDIKAIFLALLFFFSFYITQLSFFLIALTHPCQGLGWLLFCIQPSPPI